MCVVALEALVSFPRSPHSSSESPSWRRNMTDLDLERRFSMQESQGHGSLMTEEEVLRMIRKEKQERGSQAGSASRRVQRELAEWAAAKEQQRARVKSPHRFERMVVSRK